MHSFTNKKALVTGGTGFIGSALVRRIHEQGAEVHAIYRQSKPSKEDSVKWWQCDMTDITALRRIVSVVKPNFVFHLASHVAGSRSIELILPTLNNNLVSTVNLLTVATEIGCERVILTGSMEEPDSSEEWPVPSSPYAAAKFAASAYGRMFYRLYQLPVVILRVFMVYGPDQKDLKKLIPYVTLSLLAGHAPRLGAGNRNIDWVYVDDVVNGYLTSALAPDIDGYTIDIGSGQLVSIKTVVNKLVRMVNPSITPFFGALDERQMEQERVANLTDTAACMGWKPMTGLDEGLARTAAWYDAQLRAGSLGIDMSVDHNRTGIKEKR